MRQKEPRFHFVGEEKLPEPRRPELSYSVRKPHWTADILSVSAMAVAGFSAGLALMTYSSELHGAARKVQTELNRADHALTKLWRGPFRRISKALE